MKKKIYLKIISFLLMLILIITGSTIGKSTFAKENKLTVKTKNSAQKVSTRKIVDMAGRTVVIPTTVKKVFGTSQIGIIMIYTINPDKLAGWGFALNPDDKKYISSKYYNLPILGTWSGKNGTGNTEEIIKVHPDILLSVGTIDDSQKELSDRIQKQTGIPVVMADAPLDSQDKSYKFIGDIIGEKARCKVLGDYCSKIINNVKTKVSKIPKQKRVKVYYAEGLKGLETDPKGSFHTEVLDFVGGINVAEVSMQKGFGRSQVSLEQLLAWNPDVIIAGYDKDAKGGGIKEIVTNKDWISVKAVKNKKVYQVPANPFDWFDRPPGVNRIIGVEWLANLLYPNVMKLDMVTEVKNFYKEFYHKNLTNNEAKQLLKNPTFK